MDKLASKSSWILGSKDRYDIAYGKYNSDLDIIYLIAQKDFSNRKIIEKIIEVKKYQLKLNKCYCIVIELSQEMDFNIVSIGDLDFDYKR